MPRARSASRIGAAAVGFVDGLKVQGLYQTKDPLPFVPGTEFAGVVDAVASDVTAFKPGMPVIGMTRSGALAEYISVPSAALKNLPAQVPFEAGASFQANYLTGLYALDARASLRAGEILLVLGAAGGVGIAAVQIGKLMGARVIAAASTQEKRDFAVQFGADDTIDYTQPDWRETLKTMTGGHGPDVIFDPVGGDVALQAFRSIAWRGRHLVVGFASGTIPALAFNLPLLKGGALLGVDLAQIQKREPETHARLIAQLFDWLASGKTEARRRQGGAVREFPRGVQDHAVAVGAWEDDRQIRLNRRPPAAPQQDRTDASGRLCQDAAPAPHAYAFDRMHRLFARRRALGSRGVAARHQAVPPAGQSLSRGTQAGRPVHDIGLRLAIDDSMTVREAEATLRATPYPTCIEVEPILNRLIGERIGSGWRELVRRKIGRLETCTHLMELLGPAVTTLFQTMSHGKEPEGRDSLEDQQRLGQRPFFIGGCHSWRTDGPIVAAMFPQFATKPAVKD